ncbi:MAG: hypothetical protein KGH89_02370 [Thaumarchaeota archaeon]|nr:hypothetical protein [Nitrososphaerota archaeon]
MTKSSGYSRDLTKKEIKDLQLKYSSQLKRTRKGFIEVPVKQRLLHITNWEEGTTRDDVHRYFYEIREHAESALGDFLLLCDTLTEKQIKDIFEFKAKGELKDKLSVTGDSAESQKLWYFVPSLENILRAVLKSEDPRDEKPSNPWEDMKLSEQPDTWKFMMVNHLIGICFEFLKENRFVTSKSHERLVEEVLDMISSESHNTLIPIFWRKSSLV